MKRTLSMVLVLAMMLSAMLGVVSFADDSEPEGALKVSQANLEFSTAVYLYFAVDYSAVGSANGITLKITNNKTGKSTILSPDSSISAPANCVAFKYIDLGAKNMGDKLTLQALKDGKESGDAKTYSVLEYALKAQGQGNAKLSALMVAMLKYGADAQAAFSYSGSYDLTKDYTLVSVSGLASLTGDAHKTIVARGTKVTATATASDAVWYTPSAQRQATGASFEIETTKTYQAFIAVPKSVATSEEYELDMDKYTGATTTYDKDSVAALKTAMPWFSGSFTGTATGKIVLANGYMKWDTGDGMNFNSSNVAKAIGESVGAYATAKVNGTSTEGLNDTFTLSMTIAADSATQFISRWHLRYGKNSTLTTANAAKALTDVNSKGASAPFTVTAGRLSLIASTSTNSLKTIIATDGATANSSGIAGIVNLPYSNVEGTPGEFVTIHIVFDLSGNDACPACGGDGKSGSKNDTDCAACAKTGKANTIKYYVGTTTTPVATVICPAPILYFSLISNGGYLNGENGNGKGYLKSMTVTNGNFTEYFK